MWKFIVNRVFPHWALHCHSGSLELVSLFLHPYEMLSAITATVKQEERKYLVILRERLGGDSASCIIHCCSGKKKTEPREFLTFLMYLELYRPCEGHGGRTQWGRGWGGGLTFSSKPPRSLYSLFRWLNINAWRTEEYVRRWPKDHVVPGRCTWNSLVLSEQFSRIQCGGSIPVVMVTRISGRNYSSLFLNSYLILPLWSLQLFRGCHPTPHPCVLRALRTQR